MTEQPDLPPQAVAEEGDGTAAQGRDASEERHGAAGALRALHRSRDERMLAGVLGGLGQRFGIDPVLLRIATIVLAVFGGVGVVLYAAGWLLVPDEGTDRSIADQALGRGDDRPEPATLWLAGGLVLAVLFAAGATFGSGVGTVLLVLAAAGIIVLLRRDGDAPATRFADNAPDDAAGPPADGGAAAGVVPPSTAEVLPGDEGDGDTGGGVHQTTAHEQHSVAPPEDDVRSRPEYVHSFTAPVQPASAWPDPPDWPAADFDPARYEQRQPPVGTDKPARSHLTGLTLSVVAVALGILAINDVVYAAVPASAYVALALAIIGAGLLIGTWFGRARGLIAWGLIGTFIVLPVSAIGDFLNWELNGEDRTITIDDVSELPAEPRSHGMGEVVYDLGDLELTDAEDPIALDVSQNAGVLQIIVPQEVDVTVNASTGMGNIVAFGEQAAGHQDITITDLGADGAGGGELTLDLALQLGEITVERADAPVGDTFGQEVPR